MLFAISAAEMPSVYSLAEPSGKVIFAIFFTFLHVRHSFRKNKKSKKIAR